MRSSSELTIETAGRVAAITIDRPDRLNALSQSVLQGIVEAIDAAARNDDVWVITIRGRGGRAFSAGVDLKEMGERDTQGGNPRIPMTGLHRNAFEAVLECPKPTVAIIDGYALGGGFELAMACDLRIATTESVFGLPEAKRGLAANFGAQLIARLMPLAIAYEMLYLGERLSAEQAKHWGLINRAVAPDELDTECGQLLEQLLANAPLSLRRYKSTVSRGMDLPLAAALRLDPSASPYTSEDRIEGIRAFNEKRTPIWRAL